MCYNIIGGFNINKRVGTFHNNSYVDLFPVQFGYEECEPSHFISLTTYENYLFHYVIDGSGRVYIKSSDQKNSINKNEGFLITPGTTSSYKADAIKPWSYYWIEFNGIKAKSFMSKAGLTNEHYHFKNKENKSSSHLINIFEEILNSKNEALTIAQLYLLLNTIIENSQTNINYDNYDVNNIYIREALIYIGNNYNHNMTVNEIAKHCNISRTHLSRLFKQELGISPSQYLINFRLNKASELLEDNNLSINEIANKVGYSNQFNFSTAFKKKFDVPPTQWRNLQ